MLDLAYLIRSYLLKMSPHRGNPPLPSWLHLLTYPSLLTLIKLSLSLNSPNSPKYLIWLCIWLYPNSSTQTIKTLSKLWTDHNSPSKTHILNGAWGAYITLNLAAKSEPLLRAVTWYSRQRGFRRHHFRLLPLMKQASIRASQKRPLYYSTHAPKPRYVP